MRPFRPDAFRKRVTTNRKPRDHQEDARYLGPMPNTDRLVDQGPPDSSTAPFRIDHCHDFDLIPAKSIRPGIPNHPVTNHPDEVCGLEDYLGRNRVRTRTHKPLVGTGIESIVGGTPLDECHHVRQVPGIKRGSSHQVARAIRAGHQAFP